MKQCEVCKTNYSDYEHPKFDICSLECLKALNPAPKKLKYRMMHQKGQGKHHSIWVKEKTRGYRKKKTPRVLNYESYLN